MKKSFILIAGLAACAGFAQAQAVSETTTAAPVTTTAVPVTTTTAEPLQSAGSITTFDPTAGSLVVAGPNASPVTYAYSTNTTIVDADGNPVGVDVVKSGVPVTVYYTRTGDQMVVSKMVVQRAVPVQQQATTTTTTTSSSQK